MAEITIEEGNKLIAEFMGGTVLPSGICKGYTKISIPDWAFRLYNFDTLKIGGYDYHSSWDWLMPVVERIGHNNFDISIHLYIETNNGKKYNVRSCLIEDSYKGEIELRNSEELTITATWKTVIQFIQWLNSQSK